MAANMPKNLVEDAVYSNSALSTLLDCGKPNLCEVRLAASRAKCHFYAKCLALSTLEHFNTGTPLPWEHLIIIILSSCLLCFTLSGN